MPPEKENLKKAYKKALAAERKMSKLDEKVLNSLKRDIINSTKGGTYNYNKKLDAAIKRKVAILKGSSLDTQRDLQDKIERLAASTIVSAGRNEVSIEQARKIIRNINVDNFSRKMRPSFNTYKHDLLFNLKRSIAKGKGVEALARDLMTLDPAKVDIPAYITDIIDAARKALRDPAEIKAFKSVIYKHRKHINNLTRAGEAGFQHLGLRRAGRAFLRDIQKAVNDNTIDDIVDKWAKSKSKFIQQRVARTETSAAYHTYLKDYGFDADHIIGMEVKLSVSHPTYDICDELAGIYLFDEVGKDGVPIPPHHPNCICHTLYIFEEEEAQEAA